MTNEEKAHEIAYNKAEGFTLHNGTIEKLFAECAIEMAQWKDEQMKEALNNILIECDACFDEQTTNTLESIIKHQISLL